MTIACSLSWPESDENDKNVTRLAPDFDSPKCGGARDLIDQLVRIYYDSLEIGDILRAY